MHYFLFSFIIKINFSILFRVVTKLDSGEVIPVHGNYTLEGNIKSPAAS